MLLVTVFISIGFAYGKLWQEAWEFKLDINSRPFKWKAF